VSNDLIGVARRCAQLGDADPMWADLYVVRAEK
jgi:hypothetical protein